MTMLEELKQIFENHEKETVSDSFGGLQIPGRAPSFNIAKVVKQIEELLVKYPKEKLSSEVNRLNAELNQIMN